MVDNEQGKEKGDAGDSEADGASAVQPSDSMAKVAGQTATIMSLLKAQEMSKSGFEIW